MGEGCGYGGKPQRHGGEACDGEAGDAVIRVHVAVYILFHPLVVECMFLCFGLRCVSTGYRIILSAVGKRGSDPSMIFLPHELANNITKFF